MKRKGMSVGKGKKGYYNLVPIDPYIHSLSARGVKTSQALNPKTKILPDKVYNNKFAKDYPPQYISYATTRIDSKGDARIYVRDSGNKQRNDKLIKHEKKELEIYKLLVDNGVNKNIADEIAHNLNPVKLKGVDLKYPLNPYN